MSGLAISGLKFPSLLDFDKGRRDLPISQNLKNLYHVNNPSPDTYLRERLDELNPWVNHWENIKTFLKFPEEIRTIIYTTNAVESLHRQFRKVTKTRAMLPADDSLFKLLFLAVSVLSLKWTVPVAGWKNAISQFVILYDARL